MSVDYPQGEFHLLGYYIDFRDAGLPLAHPVPAGQPLQPQRRDGPQNAGDGPGRHDGGYHRGVRRGQVGRPHMARALMKKGYVNSVQEAFDRYLADGKPLHVPKVKLSPVEAIELVHSAGGVAVLAPPKYMEYRRRGLREELARLKEAGLDGLECYYSQHTEEETRQYSPLAQQFGFLVTSGQRLPRRQQSRTCRSGWSTRAARTGRGGSALLGS